MSAYSINASTGILSALTPDSGTSSGPCSILVGAGGNFVYVANNYSGKVAVYSLNQGSGVLSQISNSTPIGTTPEYIALDPSGNFGYALNDNGSTNPGMVSIYAINKGTGVWQATGSSAACGKSPRWIATTYLP